MRNASTANQLFNKKLDTFFSDAKNSLGHHFNDVLDESNLKKSTFLFSQMPVTKLMGLLDKLNVTLDSVMEGTVDYNCMRSQYLGLDCIPDKFSREVPYSLRYTTIYMLQFLREEYGDETARIVMKHLQLKDNHLADITQMNNILLPATIAQYVYEYFGEDAVESMGSSSVEIFSKTHHGKRLSQCLSLENMFEVLIDEVAPKSIERNYCWKIQNFKPNRISILGTQEPEVAAAFGNHQILSSKSGSHLRKGFISAMPNLIGISNTTINMSTIEKSGRIYDLYEINYSGG